jgi:hypothetical protein
MSDVALYTAGALMLAGYGVLILGVVLGVIHR